VNVVAFPSPEPAFITIEIPGDPVAFARARSNGARRFTPPKQRAAMTVIKDAAIKAKGKHHIMQGPVAMEVMAVFAYPASWPKYRKVEQYKTSKPDIDNLGKILADSCNGIIYHDDAQIAVMSCAKIYGEKSKVVVTFHAIAGGME